MLSSLQLFAGTQLQLPHNTTPPQLEVLLNGLLKNDDKMPYAFFINETELAGELAAIMLKQNLSVETVVDIVYQPQAVFRVRPVGRCTATLAGAPSTGMSWNNIRGLYSPRILRRIMVQVDRTTLSSRELVPTTGQYKQTYAMGLYIVS